MIDWIIEYCSLTVVYIPLLVMFIILGKTQIIVWLLYISVKQPCVYSRNWNTAFNEIDISLVQYVLSLFPAFFILHALKCHNIFLKIQTSSLVHRKKEEKKRN